MIAYGRLDVFWPDGKFQTFQLAEPTVTVGRSGGATIALDTSNISSYHFSLTYRDGQVTIADMDSANGTYVDGVRLAQNTPQALYGGEEILIGDLRLIFADFDDSPTRPMVVPEDTTQRVELETPTFRIDLIGPPQAVSPGAHISAELSITNTGMEVERYVVEVTGLPREWVRLDRPMVEIKPGKTEPVILSFKPSRRPESAPGDYHALVVVRPHRESVTMLSADLILSVLPFGGFGMALEETRLTTQDRLRLHLHNQGSAPLPLDITVENPDDLLTADISPAQVTLGPGQRLALQGVIQPRRRSLFGETQHYPFDVVVRSRDAARFTTAQRGYLTAAAPLPRWTPLALLGAVALVAIVLIAGIILFNNRPISPVIEQFTVSSTQVAPGEPIVVSWDTDNVTALMLTVNGTPVFNQAAADAGSSFTIDTTNLSGDVAISLAVNNTHDRAVASETVRVTRGLTIDQFAVTPPTLVRNVVVSMALQWNVPNAAIVRISGLESFTTTGLQPSYRPQGTITDMVGIPQQPLAVTLYAEDADGNAIEQSIVVEVIDPICAPESAAVSLRAEPRETAQVVGTVPQGNSIIVDAQDESRQWLRVVLPGGLQGWGPKTAFACASNFDVGNLRQVLVIPTVAPTIAATPTPTATTTSEPLVTATPRPAGTTLIPRPTATNAPPSPTPQVAGP